MPSDPVDPALPADLVDNSQWRPLRLLLDALDRAIVELYAEADIAGFRSRFTAPLIRLGRQGPMTIRALAAAVEVTHSAMSQTVAAMQRADLVRTSAGADARTREVTLTGHGQELLPFLEAEWRATEAAVIEIEREIPYALSQVVRDIEKVLQHRSFRDRLHDHWSPEAQDDQ